MAATRGGLARFVPALSWVPGYQLSWLSKDAIAGFTIWGLLIPEGIAYASMAGLPPQAGLYTLLASLVLYALFGTSKQLVVAGTSASAVLVYSAVSALRPNGAAAYGAGRRAHHPHRHSCSCALGCSGSGSSPSSCPGR
ncbi:MAG: SulP family inorganic anion transporter [Trebonia sp.]